MQILKPDMLSCTSQPLDWRGTLHQSFTVGLGFSLLAGEDDALLPEDEAWAAAMQGLAPGMCLDSGVPKAKPEWLLAGSVHAPNGQPAVALEADMHIGQQTRRFLVGHRQAEPWLEQPLLWSRTWGSPTHKDNPEGCGLVPDPVSGRPRLPLISDADSAHAAPACPGPRGVWPCRLQAMGTYGAAWLKERWPGVPDDFDWSFFNLAQPCQRLPDGITRRLPVVLEHVHPEHPRLHSHVPGKALRVEVLRKGEAEWEVVPATPDTLWLFPNQGVGLVLWHALVPCADEMAGDITAVRLTLVPEDARCVPPPFAPPPPPPPQGPPVLPPPPAPDPSVAGAAVAGTVATGAALAATAVAAAAMAAGGHHTSAHAPATPPQPTAAATAPATATPEPETLTRQEMLRDGMAQALEDFENHKEELNQALADLDLPPLTPEQEAEVRQRLQDGEELLNTLYDQLDADDPTMEDLLRQAGVGEDTLAQARAALELDPPDPMDFDQPEAWQAAVESFIVRVDSVLPLNETARLALREGLGMIGPGGQEKMADMAHMPNPEPTLDDILAQCGLDAGAAQQLSSGLSSLEPPDIDASNAEWAAFAAQAEAALGFAPGSMASSINAFLNVRQQLERTTPGKSPTPDAPAGATDAPQPISEAPSAPAPAESAPDAHGQPTPQSDDANATPPDNPKGTPHGDMTDDAPGRQGKPGTPEAPPAAPPPNPVRRAPPRWTAEEIAKAPPAVRAMMLRTLADDEAAASTANGQEPTS